MCPPRKAKDATENCKKLQINTFFEKERFRQRLQKALNQYLAFKGIVKRRRQSAKHKDSTQSYNKRKTRWNNTFF